MSARTRLILFRTDAGVAPDLADAIEDQLTIEFPDAAVRPDASAPAYWWSTHGAPTSNFTRVRSVVAIERLAHRTVPPHVLAGIDRALAAAARIGGAS